MVDREALNPKGLKMWCSSCRISSCSHSDLDSDFSHASNEGRGGLGKIEVCRMQQKIPMNREVLYLWLLCRPSGAVQARQGRKVVQLAREGVSELGSLQICTSSSIGRCCCCCTWCTSTTWSTPILRHGSLTITKSNVLAILVIHVVFRVPLCRLSNGQSYDVRWLLYHFTTDKDA